MSTIQTAVVLHEQAAIGLLRDWTTYLTASLTLLTPDDPTSADSFEQAASSRQTDAAERDLAAIPPDERSLFERATSQRREERRRQIETEVRAETNSTPRLVDPDELDRIVLGELLREAREPDESGHVLFPDADGQQIAWLELRVSALTERPDAATYRAVQRTTQDRKRLTRIAAGLAIVALLAFLAWYLLNPDSEHTPALTSATANGQALTPWRATRLTVNGSTATSLTLTPITSDGWPTNGQAHMRPMGLPLRVCVPDAALADATTITLVGDGGVPDRAYTLSSSPPAHPDLLITACDDTSHQIAGVVQSIRPAPLSAIGTALPISDGGNLTLDMVTVTGPAESSAVPQGAARISLRLRGAINRDWTAFVPTLRLGDGSQQMAPEMQMVAEGSTELRFLINAPSEPLAAEFRLTDPATRLVTRWQVPITPPIDRLHLLQQVLRIDGLTTSGEHELTLTITNTSLQPLTLAPTDLLLEREGTRQLLAGIRGIDTPLAAGETRSLTLVLPPELRGGATLSIGTAQYQLAAE